MPSRKIRSHNPSVSGGGGGATTISTPTARWSEDAVTDDALALVQVVAHEDVAVDDAFAYIIVKEGEDVAVDDAWRQTIISANAEDVPVNDLAKIQILNVDVGRTGTPDSDLMFDSYTNQLAAFAGTNYGGFNPLQCRGVTTVTPGSDEQRAYIAIDFTGYAGFTTLATLAGGKAFSLAFLASNSNLLTATALTSTFYYSATKPFTESTVTWNAPPTLGSLLGANSTSVAAGGGFAAYATELDAASFSPFMGKWMLIVFTGPSAATTALVDTFNIQSRDHVSASNRPKFSIAVQRGA